VVTWKLWLTGVAAAQLVLPTCVARLVQVPAATSVTVEPDTVHTAGVVEPKLTVRPEDAVALTANGAVPNGWFESVPKAMVWLPFVTWKLWFTAVASAQLVLPPCVAWMVQMPAATSVTVEPDTVQTAGVVEPKLTVKPEDAVALTAKGAVPNGWFESVPKAMVWLPFVTWKLWFTAVAAAQLVLPPCVAWMVQVPAATSVTVAPATVQKAGVAAEKLTARPEEAVALTAKGAVPNGSFESAPKVMVWLPGAGHSTVRVALDSRELLFDAVTVAVFVYSAQLEVDVLLVTCTVAVVPAARFPKLQPSACPPAAPVMVHVPGPL